MVSMTVAIDTALAAAPAEAKLAFKPDDQGNLAFDTGVVKGSVNKDDTAGALKSITYVEPSVPIDTNHGLMVPYWFLTTQRRYGFRVVGMARRGQGVG